jgi:hypothetical protein
MPSAFDAERGVVVRQAALLDVRLAHWVLERSPRPAHRPRRSVVPS